MQNNTTEQHACCLKDLKLPLESVVFPKHLATLPQRCKVLLH